MTLAEVGPSDPTQPTRRLSAILSPDRAPTGRPATSASFGTGYFNGRCLRQRRVVSLFFGSVSTHPKLPTTATANLGGTALLVDVTFPFPLLTGKRFLTLYLPYQRERKTVDRKET